MSIPLVFKPMKVDSMLLYDGGIYDNFPWRPLDVGFRPDLIVGSICTAGNTPPGEDINILDQAFMLAMHDTDYDLPKGRSVTVRRAVDVNMLDFDSAVAVMDSRVCGCDGRHAADSERVSERWSPQRYADGAKSSAPNARRWSSTTINSKGSPRLPRPISATS